jgi:hypothetical protein
MGPKGEKIAAGKVDRMATLSRINKRLAPQNTVSSKTAVLKKKANTTKPLNRSLDLLSALLAASNGASPIRGRKQVLTVLPRRRILRKSGAMASPPYFPRMR